MILLLRLTSKGSSNGFLPQWDCEKSDEAPEVVAVSELALPQGLAS
ncbi:MULTISPECIES: hypothetical protein [Moorena]|uniref:Uncharacterized protein n=1 Tax=Moorena producens 3L TaxID=489825 RepID=F4XVG5_9CYAN|nr:MULTISPECIES: hypothetical protein [Moorena]EGJ31513.1 hypothetical protein LYNGBM3L_38670 [Moorena producens 3L]NEP31333.1 hypothetical protein [Moorena sp. SIO3B2]NEP65919.1 hypothetical protein [Moorena sp. SIO3A5]NEQ05277.1 hypothetical protein [Moorena sp. SIO4E2]NER87413.1 hypothetical protein [Moorena sp. SIO3A2]